MLVLHPRYKLKYFKRQGWDKEWIETTETIVREEFKASYVDYVICKPLASGQASKKMVRLTRVLDHLYYTYMSCARLQTFPIAISQQMKARTQALMKTSLRMSWTSTFQLGKSRPSQTLWSDGLRTEISILIYGGWHKTTYQFQVCIVLVLQSQVNHMLQLRLLQ